MNTDDEDDFGDFEEAQVEESQVESEPIEVPESDIRPGPSNKERLESISQSFDADALIDLLNDENLWNLEHLTADEQLQCDDNLFDLFSYFCNNLTDSLISDDAKQPIELWRLLQVVEETNALNFRWTSSQLYTNFINALSFYGSQKLDSTAKICMPKNGFMTNGEFGSNGGTSNISLEESDNQQWNSATTSTNFDTNLDCDFFQSDSRTNGPSVLEQELNALGLSGQSKNSTPKHSNYSQSLVNGTNHVTSKVITPCYLSVSELNTEAQSFYERMPDLNFMLVDRVILEK